MIPLFLLWSTLCGVLVILYRHEARLLKIEKDHARLRPLIQGMIIAETIKKELNRVKAESEKDRVAFEKIIEENFKETK